jgi:chromatin remodeling complex protein RSC6
MTKDAKVTKDTKVTKDKKNSAFMKPVHVSETLAEIVGTGPMPRTEVTKKVWEYIKKHKLQDETNKRNINPDAKLGKVLGSTQAIDMFKMTGKIAKHLTQPEASAAKK